MQNIKQGNMIILLCALIRIMQYLSLISVVICHNKNGKQKRIFVVVNPMHNYWFPSNCWLQFGSSFAKILLSAKPEHAWLFCCVEMKIKVKFILKTNGLTIYQYFSKKSLRTHWNCNIIYQRSRFKEHICNSSWIEHWKS